MRTSSPGGRRDPSRSSALATFTRRPDLAGVLCLIGLSLLLLGAVPWLANERLTFGMGPPPASLALTGFYPAERNDAGTFRWAMPAATIGANVAAPGTYRIALKLQEGPTRQAPRTVRVTINDQPRGEWTLAPEVREFSATYTLSPEERRGGKGIVVRLDSPPLTIGSDPRALGPVVTQLRIGQQVHFAPWQPRLLVLCLLALGGGYLLLRLGGLSVRPAIVALGLLALAVLLAAGLDRPAVLRLLYQPFGTPIALWAAGFGVLGVAGLLYAERRPLPWLRRPALRDALFVAIVMLLSCTPYLTQLGFYGDDWLFLERTATAREQSVTGSMRALWENDQNIRQRPLQIVYTALVFAAFGESPTPYHLINATWLPLTIVLLLLVLRALGVTRPVALAIALLYGLLPHYSTDRFWFAAASALQSQGSFFLALLLGLLAVRQSRPRRAVGLAALAAVASAVSLLSYEVVLPLQVLGFGLIWWHGRRAGRAHRWLAAFVVAQSVGLAAILVAKSRISNRAAAGNLSEQVPLALRQLVRWNYGPSDYGLNLRKAVEIGYGDLGLSLPRTAIGLADRYTDGATMILAVVLFLLIAAYVGQLRPEPAANRWTKRVWALWACGGVLVFWAGYGTFLLTSQVQLVVSGLGNRTAIAATLGVAITLVAALGWFSVWLPARWRRPGFAGAVALLCCCGCLTFATSGLLWGQASQQQGAILAAIQRQYPTYPTGQILILDGACPYAGPAQVFESSWDLAGALAVLYDDPTIRADIVTPRLTVEPDRIETVIHGAVRSRYPYGDTLIAFNYRRGIATPLADRAAAMDYFQRTNPRFDSGCPASREGFGVRLLPWGNP